MKMRTVFRHKWLLASGALALLLAIGLIGCGTMSHSRLTSPAVPSSTTSTIPVSSAAPDLVAKAATSSFSDVPPSYAYAAAIADVATRHIVDGFPDATFRPEASVLRMEFAKMIDLSLGLTVTVADKCPFPDVPSGLDSADPLYPDHYVAVADSHHITEGITPTTFAPYGSVSRFQVISMVVRGISSDSLGLLVTPPSTYLGTSGWGTDPDHGQDARVAQYNGLLAGLPLSTLDP